MKRYLLCMVSAATLAGCSPFQQNSSKPTKEAGSTGNSDQKNMIVHSAAALLPAETKSAPAYVLPIKGLSKNLTEAALRKTLNWRADMLTVVKNHPTEVWLNGPNQKKVALTFDDGPDFRNTPRVLTILDKYHIKASFFFTGENVKTYPAIVKRTYASGHLVSSHSYSHKDLSQLTAAEVQSDLAQTDNAIFKVIGKKPAFFRPPYGALNETVIAKAAQQDSRLILWSIDTLDAIDSVQINGHEIVNNVLDNIRNGDIILMHSDEDEVQTPKMLPHIIEELTQRGFEIVDLQTLLQQPAYK